MENRTNQSLRMAPTLWVEDACTKTQFMGLQNKVENGELHNAITTHGSKLVGGRCMDENAIHGGLKKSKETDGKNSAAAHKDNKDVVSREDLKCVFEKFGTVKVIGFSPFL